MEYTACFTGRSTRRILGEDIVLSGSLFRGSAPAFAFGERDSPCADVPKKKKSLGSSINCLKVVSQCITYPYYGQNHDSYNKQPVLFIQIHTGDIELSDIAENDSAYYCHRNRFFNIPMTKVPIPNEQNVRIALSAVGIQLNKTELSNTPSMSPQYLSASTIKVPQQIYPSIMENITSNVIRNNLANINFRRFIG